MLKVNGEVTDWIVCALLPVFTQVIRTSPGEILVAGAESALYRYRFTLEQQPARQEVRSAPFPFCDSTWVQLLNWCN